MRLRRRARSILCAFLLCVSVSAQLPSAAQSSHSDQSQAQQLKTLRQEALALLREVIAEAQSLRVAENRAWVLMRAATTLWGEDQESARALFRIALNSANE